MDEDFKRFEDKQKLANLMIEKRFIQMEEAVDRIKKESAADAVNELRKDFNEIKDDVLKFQTRFEEELKSLRLLEEKVINTRTDEKIHEMFIKFKQFEASFDQFNLRVASLEKQRLQQPIFID